jgi:glycosyltransferase involved in cell wall biosynthesis
MEKNNARSNNNFTSEVKYSICLVTFNRLNLFKQALQAIEEKTEGNYELFIWDNQSTDGTREFIERLEAKENWKIILSKENIGQTPAVNRCLKKARGKYVFQVDDDVIGLSQGWNRHLVKVIELDERIGYASPVTSERFIEEFKKNIGMGVKKLEGYTLLYPGGGGFCCCTPKELFVSIGGFPEIEGLKYYNEDDMYKMEIHKRGYRMVFVEEVIANHHRARHDLDPIETIKERKKFWQYFLKKYDGPMNGFARRTIEKIDRELIAREGKAVSFEEEVLKLIEKEKKGLT